MFNPFSLNGKIILVTGASSGIGESIAIESSKMGADIIITGRNAERLNATFSQLSGINNAQIISDLTKSEDIDSLIGQLPPLDGLVLNAGILKTMPVKNVTNSAISEVFNTNIISSIQLVQKLLKIKKIKKNASIVFISSISSFSVKIGNSLYSATKGAINSFMKVLALELAPQKITVNSIQPGFIKTRALSSGIITDEQLEEHFKIYPLGIGKPSDIAYACIYLLSDAAEWVTGSIFTIDGGVTTNGGH
ncbi:MAG: SDR family oxidoreductase [Lentimicrobiaceae bacterium]|jgi:NAD(P)-dependent dehydrogenase (short-subunit alcohol dehydrogenase family)|nr:SDR family oxidoreductase [Lentimicrobiaceae bacterium]